MQVRDSVGKRWCGQGTMWARDSAGERQCGREMVQVRDGAGECHRNHFHDGRDITSLHVKTGHSLFLIVGFYL